MARPTRLRAAGLITLAVLVFVSAASATKRPPAKSPAPQPKAAEPKTPAFAFEDERALKVGWPRLVDGLELEVCNTGKKKGTFEPRLVGFDFEIDDRPVNSGDIVFVMPQRVMVAAGKCQPLRLRAGGRSPDAGDYSGVIVLRTPTALVRREMTVSAPRANQTKAEALADEVGLRAERDGKGGDLSINSRASLPLRGLERLLVPKKDETIGVLQNGSHRLSVIVDGEPSPAESPRYLPIRIEGSDEVGTYAGTVDLSVGEGAATPLKLKLEASDRLWVPLALIALGLIGAVIGLLYLQHVRPKGQLHDRRRELGDSYTKAKTDFDQYYGQARFSPYAPDSQAVTRYQTTLKQSINRYANDNCLFKRDSDEFKELVRSLQAAEADAAFFGDRDGFGKKLAELDKMVTDFHADHPASAPRFIELAAARLKGTALPVGGATKVAAEVDGYVRYADDWKRMAQEAKRLEAWVAKLEDVEVEPAEAQMLATAKGKINEAKMELRDAESAEALEAVGAKRDLRQAYGLLAVLGSKHGWAPSEAELQAAELRDISSESYDWAEPLSLDDLIARAKGRDIGGFLAAVLGRTVRGAADAAVLAVAVSVAILAALPTVVADDTFGSWRDYLVALGLGGTSVIAARGIIDIASQLRGRERV